MYLRAGLFIGSLLISFKGRNWLKSWKYLRIMMSGDQNRPHITKIKINCQYTSNNHKADKKKTHHTTKIKATFHKEKIQIKFNKKVYQS